MDRPNIFKIYLIYFISMTLFCVLRILSAFNVTGSLHPDIADIIYTVLIQVVLMFLLPLVLYTIFNRHNGGLKTTFKQMRFKSIGFKTVLISIALGVIAFIINIAVSTVFSGIIGMFGYSQPITGTNTNYSPLFPNWLSFLIEVISVALLPAICEEFLHRGILLQGTYKIGVKKAIFISSILFGLVHFNINQFFYAFVLGLLMSLVAIVARSIYPAIIIHFINNFISIYISAAENYGWFGKNFYNGINGLLKNGNAFLTFIICFVILISVVAILVWLVSKLYKISTLNKVKKVIDSVYTKEEREITNSPIMLEKNRVTQNMQENQATLDISFEEMKSPIDIVLPKQNNVFKPKYYDNLFLIGSLVLGSLVTIFTFVWGLLWLILLQLGKLKKIFMLKQ